MRDANASNLQPGKDRDMGVQEETSVTILWMTESVDPLIPDPLYAVQRTISSLVPRQIQPHASLQ